MERSKGAKKERINLQTMKRRKANCTGHMFRRKCLLKHVIEENTEGRIEATGIRGQNINSYLTTLREREDVII